MTTRASSELVPPVAFVKRRYSIASILAELWDSRDLVMQFVQRDLTVRYTQAVMGFAWALMFLSSGRMPPPPPQSQIEQEAGERKNRETARGRDGQ